MSTPKTDPLIRTMRKVYAASATSRVQKLLADERKWRRRETIAQSKLDEIRLEIRLELSTLATEADKKGVES